MARPHRVATLPPQPEAGHTRPLVELSRHRPGLRRWLHGLVMLPGLRIPLQPGWPTWRRIRHLTNVAVYLLDGVARLLWRIVRRVADWSWDNLRALVLDTYDRLMPQPDRVIRAEPGTDPARDARSVAVFVQYSPDGMISDMVARQIEMYRSLGFAVVLVSNSPAFPDAAWQVAVQRASLVVWRRNAGLDFGAWKDVVPLALQRWPQAEELLLVNDSVLGPIRPIDPLVASMRAAGPGVFGLLESHQGGPHLQSWFTLARGGAAIADVARFLHHMRLSRSKWKIVQRGELRLARSMQAAGHRVAAFHAYEELVRLGLEDAAERAYLERALPAWSGGGSLESFRRALGLYPVNPAHHLWRVLNGPAGCPFIKTELVRRNPGKLPEVDSWPDLVRPDAPCPVGMIRAHLAALGP